MRHASATAPHPGGLAAIDALRFWLAIYVCCHHASYLLWRNPAMHAVYCNPAGYASMDGHPGQWIVSGMSIFWEEAVRMFFLISGFCIHWSAARLGPMAWERIGIRQYAGRRFWRIVPPAWAAILLTVLCDSLAHSLHPTYYGSFTLFSADSWSVKTFVLNALFLQDWISPMAGSNLPLWSVHCEMVYYILYPAVLWFASRGNNRLLRWGMIYVAACALLAMHSERFPVPRALREYPYWIAGAIVAEIFASNRFRPGWWAVGLGSVLFLQHTAVGWVEELTGWQSLPPLAAKLVDKGTKIVGGPLLLLGLVSCAAASPRVEAFCHRLAPRANFSYSLYLIHFPIIGLVATLGFRWFGAVPDSPLAVVLGSVMAIAVAVPFFLLIEKPAMLRGQNRRG